MPAAAARASTSSTGPRTRSRWQCASNALAGSGAGSAAGGRPYWSRTGVVTGLARSLLTQPGQFLLHDGRVKLGEQRGWGGQRRARLDRLGLPAGGRVVVAGDHRVGRAAVFVDLFDVRGAGPIALATQP